MTVSAGDSNASGPTAETSVSGLSDKFREAFRAYAKSRNEKLRVVYDEALRTLIERINGGEDVIFPSVVAGQDWKARHIRISADVKAQLDETCKRVRVHRSVFFHKAVRDYLVSNGVDAPP